MAITSRGTFTVDSSVAKHSTGFRGLPVAILVVLVCSIILYVIGFSTVAWRVHRGERVGLWELGNNQSGIEIAITAITEPCNYTVAVGIEKEYFPDKNIWATSEYDDTRASKYARLNGRRGGGAWTAKTPNNVQHIGVDLGYRHIVRAVATQGRRGSNEYVTEYYLEFSSDNKTWMVYANKSGSPLLLDGNFDDDTVKRNDLEYPIVARYIRFNPERWNHFISMRVEIYGCGIEIAITEPCRYAVAVGIEKEYIPDKNIWATSHYDYSRASKYARLNGQRGGGAWTAGTPNIFQRIGVDLGYRQVVTAVATQGCQGSGEYVTEYYLEFSNDKKTWTVYADKYGTPVMFDGNFDDDTVKRNDLEYPIVTRYIRFNPQRWNHFISMRVEIYGCDAEVTTFDGKSRLTYDVSGVKQNVHSRSDHLKLRFRTIQESGLLFYADGNQGDYLILEMNRGRLYLHIDLGSTPAMNGQTTLLAGSLLDDNHWHDVEFTREGREINFRVDRFTITNLTNGEFSKLDLDRHINLGGIDNFLHSAKPMLSRANFTGCMENVWFGDMNIIKDARMNQPRFQKIGFILLGLCLADPVVPMTFPTIKSHLKLTSETGTRMRVSMDFRTYNKGGLLFWHVFSPSGSCMLKINYEGHLEYRVETANDPPVENIIKNRDVMAELDIFADGLWHSVEVDIESGGTGWAVRVGLLNFTIDGRPVVTRRQLWFRTTSTYYIGGGDDNGKETNFLGCMRYIKIGNERVDEIPAGANSGVVYGACVIRDRCDPNPCEHGGICSQDHNTFECNCSHTGYEGATCHRSKYLVSCEEARMMNPTIPEKYLTIDIDDSGPLQAFNVKCVFQHDIESVITEVPHENMAPTLVDGYQEPGSYVRPIIYEAQKEQFDVLIERAYDCEQYIKYRCEQSRLLSDPGTSDPHIPSWGWWIGRTNLNMRYWGGTSPGSGKCACALKDECKDYNPTCNCDAGLLQSDIYDDGYIWHKEHLPVMELRFGDTGTLGDRKWGEHTLGPLRCRGDKLFDNVVTFRKANATFELPTFEAGASGDIRFQFKTTQVKATLLQNTGKHHFIEVKLVFYGIRFRFDVRNGIQTLEKITPYPLNDNNWHTVHIERNRKQAMLKIDQQAAITLDEPIHQGFRPLQLSSPLVIGAAVNYEDGYLGCMRGLMVNGVLHDLRGMVERDDVTYGVAAGCLAKCASNPCFNGGICIERYSTYQCDCYYTPYIGWDCGREVGVNMQANYMVKFGLDQATRSSSTDEETIIIGFSTWEKKGILMLIRNDNNEKPEYISVEMNNNGGVKVALDVGFERYEVNTDIPDVDLANGQQHVAFVQRTHKGRTLTVHVDDYPPTSQTWDLPDGADTRLDNPAYIYLGRKESTRPGYGFKGCLFRAQFYEMYPLKRAVQDPRPDNIEVTPDDIHESMCGFREVTHTQKASEPEDQNTTKSQQDWIPEVGVNMQANYMVKFGLDQATRSSSTDEETIIIGFSTWEKKGILMLIRNDNNEKPEYISVEMNNNGGVKVALDVGFGRYEVNTDIPHVDLANGQQHVTFVQRTNKGRTLTINVDDYPPLSHTWDFPDGVDTSLDNPAYIYFGRKESTRPGYGFKGCLFRAQFNDLYPLKRALQNPRPDNVEVTPDDIHESMCGFREVTHSPEDPARLDTQQGWIPASHLHAAQAMITIGLIGLLIAMILIIIYMCASVSKKVTMVFLVTVCFLSIIFMLIGFLVFGIESGGRVHWSFGITVVAAIFCLVAGILAVIQIRRSGVHIS